jgi:TonB-linked SusC/RagA family outer membrane protein
MKKNKPIREFFFRSLTKTLVVISISSVLMIMEILQTHAKDAEYEIIDSKIILIPGDTAKESEDLSLIQQKVLTGKVTDTSTGEAMPGVNVLIKGTAVGTLTDGNGNYTLPVPDQNNAILVFSFIGYGTKEVPVAGSSSISIGLEPELTGLEEVVVIGYGTARKSDLTGSVMSVGADKFENQPIIRMDQALQGKAAGVELTQTSGSPDAGYKIRIRGSNSISGNNAPLYVVDGLIVGDINSINSNDIKSIEVLKDASATAIYGSRASNGVILVSTKRGIKGKGTISFETFHGISNVVQTLPIMNAGQYAEGVNFLEGYQLFSQAEIDALYANDPQSMQEAAFKPAPSHNYQMTFSGGNDKVDYYLSGNYYTAEGTVYDQNYNRYIIRGNINASITDKVKIGFNVSGSRSATTGNSVGIPGIYIWDRTTPPYNAAGEYNFNPVLHPGVGGGLINPLVGPSENTRDNYVNQIITSTYLDIQILKNLVLNISGGLEWRNRNLSTYTTLLTSAGVAAVDETDDARLQNTNRLTYTLERGSKHRLQIDAIHEQQSTQRKIMNVDGSGFFSDVTTYKKMALASIQLIDNFNSNENLQSFLGRVNYSLNSRYLFTASLRSDGSSKFQEGNQWGYFPSASVAWRLSEEGFMKGIEQIDDLKLRASYGITGSQAIDPLATRSQPVINTNLTYPFSGADAYTGVAPSNRLANPNLTWEETSQINAGFNISLWKSRVTFEFDVYKKTTTDLLLDRILPEFVGPTVIAENVGKVENKGFEFSLGLHILSTSDWNITTNIVFNRNRNTVLELVDDKPFEKGNVYVEQTLGFNPTRLEVGESMSMFRGYVFEGVYQLGEEAEAAIYGRKPGNAKYADLNGDNKITTDDVTLIGKGYPDFTFGINGEISWKKLSLNYLFTGSVGNDIYNLQRARMMGLGSGTFHASHADYLDRWTTENPSDIPSARDKVEILSTQFLDDGSYFTLKNLTLGYTFDNFDAFKAIGLNELRVYGNITNAFILTNYTGFDPESTSTGDLDVDVGIDHGAYPLARTFTAGIKITF